MIDIRSKNFADISSMPDGQRKRRYNMKKASSLLLYLLFVMTVLYPAGYLVSACFGYRFELISIPFFAVAIVLLSLCMVILDIVCKGIPEGKGIQILRTILTPLSLINALFYILECPQISVIASTLLSAGCLCYLTLKCRKLQNLKTVALASSVVLMVPICFISFLSLLFGNIAHETVVQTIGSPNGTYYAEVIDRSEGALGGSTAVDVYENCGIDAILFRIRSDPQRVYLGRWGEFKTMKIAWKDDGCLIINSVAYEIG